jgi:hypothetical protein
MITAGTVNIKKVTHPETPSIKYENGIFITSEIKIAVTFFHKHIYTFAPKTIYSKWSLKVPLPDLWDPLFQ